MYAYKGSFAANTGTGNQTISGIVDETAASFTPKAILIWTTFGTSAAFADGWTFQIGMTDGTTTLSAQTAADDNVAAQRSRCQRSATNLVQIINSAGTALRTGAFVSFGSGQFVINWTTATGASEIFHYLALGGTDLNVLTTANRMDQIRTSAVASVASLAGIISCGAYTSTIGEMGSSFGWVALNGSSGVSNQGVSHAQIRDNVNPSQTKRFQRLARCRFRLTASLGAGIESFMDQDGMGFANHNADSNAFSHDLLLGGISVAGSSGLQPTSTGTQAVTGLGFSPKCVLVMSVGQTAQTTTQNEARLSLGAADRTRQGYAIAGSNNGVTPSVSVVNEDTSHVISCITPNATAASSTTDAQASIQSVDGDGFTLNWNAADATQRQYLWLAFGDAAPSGGGERSNTFVGY